MQYGHPFVFKQILTQLSIGLIWIEVVDQGNRMALEKKSKTFCLDLGADMQPNLWKCHTVS